MYLCIAHRAQIYKHGKIIRTMYDSNEIITHKNYAEILLYNRSGEEIAKTKVDLEDVDELKKYKIGFDWSGGYAITKVDSKPIFIHRIIMNTPNGSFTDHINGDRLDNRKQNLRLCTYQNYNRNRRVADVNKSGVTGVYYSKTNNKWVAQIKNNGKIINLGFFENIEDAGLIRLKAEQILFKEFSPNKDEFYKLNEHKELENLYTIEDIRKHTGIGKNKRKNLNEIEIQEICILLEQGGLPQQQIADLYQISQTSISRVNKRKEYAANQMEGLFAD